MRTPIRFVRYEADEVLRLVAGLSREAELAHRRLSDYHFSTGRWPAAGPQACQLSRVPESRWPRVLAELAGVGWRRYREHFLNSWVRRRRAEAESAVRLRRLSGRKAARTRWNGGAARLPPSRPGEPPISTPAGSGPEPAPMRSVCKSHTNRIPNACNPHATRILPNNTGPETHVEELGTPPALNVKNVKDVNGTSSPIRLSAERLTRSASPLGQNGPGEKEFLQQVRELFGPNGTNRARLELDNWGGWWRNRYRENPDKARRVLSGVSGLVRGRKITASPGAAAVDLWKRLP
jgi:hypothetical protein